MKDFALIFFLYASLSSFFIKKGGLVIVIFFTLLTPIVLPLMIIRGILGANYEKMIKKNPSLYNIIKKLDEMEDEIGAAALYNRK